MRITDYHHIESSFTARLNFVNLYDIRESTALAVDIYVCSVAKIIKTSIKSF